MELASETIIPQGGCSNQLRSQYVSLQVFVAFPSGEEMSYIYLCNFPSLRHPPHILRVPVPAKHLPISHQATSINMLITALIAVLFTSVAIAQSSQVRTLGCRHENDD